MGLSVCAKAGDIAVMTAKAAAASQVNKVRKRVMVERSERVTQSSPQRSDHSKRAILRAAEAPPGCPTPSRTTGSHQTLVKRDLCHTAVRTQRTMSAAPRAPEMRATSAPPLNITMVGMLRMA